MGKSAEKVIDDRGNELVVVNKLSWPRRLRRACRPERIASDAANNYATNGEESMIAFHAIFSMYGFWLPNDPRALGLGLRRGVGTVSLWAGDQGAHALERGPRGA